MTISLPYSAVLIAIPVMVLSGCGPHPKAASAQDKAISGAHQVLSNSLKDPQSAQFRNERLTADSKTLCGEVNGKNGYGGYVGFRPYLFRVATNEAFVSPGTPDFQTLVSYRGSIASIAAKQAVDQVADACLFQIEWMEKCLQGPRPADWDQFKKSCEGFIEMRPKIDALPNE
jgi:hypothetical protein